MKKLVVFLVVLFLMGCAPVPHSVDGMIVTRPDGTEMKIEWDEGRGNAYFFYTKVLVITQKGDSLTEWRIIRE